MSDARDDQEVPGLAVERTDLAWSRSWLAVLVCVAAVARHLLPDVSTLDAREVVGTALAVGGVAWVLSWLWGRSFAAPTLAGRTLADPRKLQTIAIGTAALGVMALVIAFLPAP